MRYAWIAAGGAAGAAARWALGMSFAAAGWSGVFPAATLLANLTGAFALGYAAGRWAAKRGSSGTYQALTVGFLGAFTTVSAFGFETWTLLSEGRAGLAALYAALSASAGPALAFAGMRASGSGL